tara:strand:+ start:65 stop:529 length:465 start_codon:yes stop_codon:yes gene_type:complete
MKIVFLHGLESSPNSTKATYLRSMGHNVVAPHLPKDLWEQSVMEARRAIEQHQPDVVVGSSRGGAIAMTAMITGPRVPTVLVAPAWMKYCPWATTTSDTVVVHSTADDVVPHKDSEKLQAHFGVRLVSAGSSHRMSDPEALEAIVSACEGLIND